MLVRIDERVVSARCRGLSLESPVCTTQQKAKFGPFGAVLGFSEWSGQAIPGGAANGTLVGLIANHLGGDFPPGKAVGLCLVIVGQSLAARFAGPFRG